MEEIEKMLCEIISFVGNARSMYIEAIKNARCGKIDEAEELIQGGQKVFLEGHHVHAALNAELSKIDSMPNEYEVLLMHAEDQLMSAETFGILAEEMIELYKILKNKGILN